MAYIKTFENFNEDILKTSIFIANPEAEILVDSNILESEKLFHDNNAETIKILESAGFSSPKDFFIFEEDTKNEPEKKNLDIKFIGKSSTPKGTEIYVTINGHRYGYSQKDGENVLDINVVARKFEKMLQFSAGKAIAWLKRNSILTSGGKNQEQKDVSTVKENEDHEEHVSYPEKESTEKNARNYMFFQNLKAIKSHIDMIMSLDQDAIDQLLDNGHDWASDHISTSKDDIEEVCGWLCANLK